MNTKILLLLTLSLATSLMIGCTRNLDVQAGKYALLLHMGKVEKSVEGPGKIHKSFIIESVIYIEKKNRLTIESGKYSIEYTVFNPELYYTQLHNSNAYIQRLLEKHIANRATSGEKVDSKKAILKVIEGMDLPIKIDSIT